eukprot:GHRQ01021709.1.p1 GENE.GHRQ01021709.1~~GHRQ01021709.1.p1  ORF type:complete len:409 (+),score=143.19 GHRQ01021709.1:407-1633(+)
MATQVTAARMYVSHISENLYSVAEVPELHNNNSSSSITSLNLHSNRITRIDACISRLVNLTSLNLSSNSIRAIENLSGLLNLTSLNLASNSLCELQGLAGLTALRQLNASFNALTCIAGISELHGSHGSLQQLNLQHNRLSSLQALAPLAGCLQLQLLKVGGNQCTLSRAAYVALRQVLPHVRQLDESEAASLAASWQMAQAQLEAFDHSTQQQHQPSSSRLEQDSRGSKAAKSQLARDAQPAARSLPQPRARPAAEPADISGSPRHAGQAQSSSDDSDGNSSSPDSQATEDNNWLNSGTGQAFSAKHQQQLPSQHANQQHDQQHRLQHPKEPQLQEAPAAIAAAGANKRHKARTRGVVEQHASVAGQAVATAEAVVQTDHYTPPVVEQLQADAQVLREQLSKLAGGC